jgi:mRNA-degrading endonuclease RelE of RelBE toxin-antitoxin system
MARLGVGMQDAVRNAMVRVQADPWLAGKSLHGHMRPLWSARVGSYRILYTIDGSETSATVVVRAIRHRAVAYRRPRS